MTCFVGLTEIGWGAKIELGQHASSKFEHY